MCALQPSSEKKPGEGREGAKWNRLVGWTKLAMGAELPPADTIRWLARRKAAVVVAVRAGQITFEEACSYYHLSEEELLGWQHAFDSHGLRGLSVKRLQGYRRNAKPQT